MRRKLASLQTIDSLEPIKGADRIELAKVLGWNAVVKKGDFQVGDLCVFFEIDSILPAEPPWTQFLKDHSFKVKTRKFRGIISQGLALPLDILPPSASRLDGDDVTTVLGVTQWEPPEDSYVDGAKSFAFPAGIPKSHATRVQSCPEVLDELRGVSFVATMKCDGKSATYLKRGGELIVASHKCAMERADNIFWQIAERYDLEHVIPDGTAVQGEICGPGIAKNRMGLDDVKLFVFDVFSVGEARYLSHGGMVCFCDECGLWTVPVACVVHQEKDFYTIMAYDGPARSTVKSSGEFQPSLQWFLELAQGTYPGTTLQREGLVVKPLKEMTSEALGLGRLQFKVHSQKYLLKSK